MTFTKDAVRKAYESGGFIKVQVKGMEHTVYGKVSNMNDEEFIVQKYDKRKGDYVNKGIVIAFDSVAAVIDRWM